MSTIDKKINVIFWGTSNFAAIILHKLILAGDIPTSPIGDIPECRLRITALVTRPDKPVGRQQIPTPPPVKLSAPKNNLPIFQPTKLDAQFLADIQKMSPDLFIVAAYGKIIPEKIITLPKFGTLNVHPSLLPRYRGPSPIQTALLNGDETTGVTIIKLDAEMDHGPIVNKQLTIINKQDGYLTLSQKLATISSDLLITSIPKYINGQIKPIEQNHSAATFTKLIKKQDGQITATETATQIYNMWRAYTPWPGIFGQLTINNKQLTIKLINISLTEQKHQLAPLQLFSENKNLYLACANNSTLQIISLQPEGKKIMAAQSFINGYLK